MPRRPQRRDDEAALLPHDDDAERAVLGTLLLGCQGLERLSFLSPPDFYRPRNALVFAAVLSVAAAGQPIDFITVRADLASKGTLDAAGGAPYVASLIDGQMRTPNVEAHGRIVKALAGKRLVLKAMTEITEQAMNGGKVPEIRETIAAYAATLDQELRKCLGEVEQERLARIDLGTVMTEQQEPVPWVVPGWLADGDLCIIGGEPGTGKSLLGLDLAMALAMGTDFLSYTRVREPQPVLIADEENNPKLARHRLRLMLRGRSVSSDRAGAIPIRYLPQNGLNLDRAESEAALRREMDEVQPKWLFLDSMIRFHARDENSNSEMSEFFAQRIRPLASDYGCGVTLYHHLAKPSKDRPDIAHRLRGASDILAMVDEFWGLEGDRATSTRTLRHEKCRWAECQQTLALSYSENDEGTQANLYGVPLEKDAETIIREILDDRGPRGALRGELVSALENEGLKASSRAASRALGKLKGIGAVKMFQDGRMVRYWIAREAPDDPLYKDNEGHTRDTTRDMGDA